ncbi:hypothetical protein KC363_g516 [Hortaea werneckii]|uniref:Uncharacterized protein n=1 Tax=Hortaea werneckii TaxID=91943 RepID=A0A3M7G3H3_HORWE|nr:hypothetical protein KC363_g516 [Hortaea werneckii]RMY95729.1 hypothetical protein D0861_00606 [Hortaea werneckii]
MSHSALNQSSPLAESPCEIADPTSWEERPPSCVHFRKPSKQQSSLNGENSKFSFILCGGPTDATTVAARKQVRSQAAKRCSEQRKATIAARYHHGKPDLVDTGRVTKKVPKRQPRRRISSEKNAEVSPMSSRRASEISSVPTDSAPSSPIPVAQATTSLVVDQCVEEALTSLSPPAAENVRAAIKPHALQPSPFFDGIIRMSSAMQSTSANSVAGNVHLLLLRQDVLEMINHALMTGSPYTQSLAAIIAVAASWEGRFGDVETRKMHLRAFHDVVHGRLLASFPTSLGNPYERPVLMAFPDASSTPSLSPSSMRSEKPSPEPLSIRYPTPPTPISGVPQVMLDNPALAYQTPTQPTCLTPPYGAVHDYTWPLL